MRKPLRRILRLILFGLARWALKKHRPAVIAIVGEGKTAIVREAIYAALKNHLPVRRNLEAPDAEFVLPLTILGAKEYPLTALGWLGIISRSFGQLLFRSPHKHFLILEIGYARKEIFDYFWQITQPQVLVRCGKASYLGKDQTASQTFLVKETEDLSGYLKVALRIAKNFGISSKEAERSLIGLALPKARIRILPARAGGIVIDATYQYFPPSEEALDEVLEVLPGKKVVLSPKDHPDEDFEVKDGETVVLTGPTKKMWLLLARLAKVPWI